MTTETFHVGLPVIAVQVTADDAERHVSVVPQDWSTRRGVTQAERRRVNACLTRALQAMRP